MKGRKARLKKLKAVPPQRFEEIDELPDYVLGDGRVIPGPQRCNGVGLTLGDCQQRRQPGSIYCYYHHKVSVDLLEPTASVYPVWPLPLRRWALPHISQEDVLSNRGWVRSS